MHNPVEIENIEELRRQEGIDDVELRKAIGGLHVGDFVKLTLLTGANASAGKTIANVSSRTVLVRITRVRGSAFRGVLADRPAAAPAGLSELRAGARVVFTTAHIHSIPKAQSPHEQ